MNRRSASAVLLFLASASSLAAAREPFVILAAADDPVVPATRSKELFSRWHAAGHSAELHLYATAGHGFGMLEQGLPSDRWIEMFYEWLVAGNE